MDALSLGKRLIELLKDVPHPRSRCSLSVNGEGRGGSRRKAQWPQCRVCSNVPFLTSTSPLVQRNERNYVPFIHVPTPALLLFVLLLVAAPLLVHGETYDNVGFQKGVPQELREKFPVCDEFLDVKWIDPKRYIGKTKATYYRGDKCMGTYYLLVFAYQWWTHAGIGRRTFISYHIGQEDYLSNEFEKFVRKASYNFGGGHFFLTMRAKGRRKESTMALSPMRWWSRGDGRGSFSCYTKNVCLVHPRQDAVTIVEDKMPFYEENWGEALKQRYEAILREAQKLCGAVISEESQYTCDMTPVEFGTSIDVDLDGREDYVSGFNLVTDRPRDRRQFVLASDGVRFAYIPRRCYVEFILQQAFSYRVDERSVYYGTCNLTEMLKGGK
jgi:hypothetical protein